VINGQDQSILSFRFAEEKLNPPVEDTQFKFQMPAGATLVSGEVTK
jgi:outer membrane lipoprotein-sorting protein